MKNLPALEDHIEDPVGVFRFSSSHLQDGPRIQL